MSNPENKFGRQYRLRVELAPRVPGSAEPKDAGGWVEIKLPLTCEFTITRNMLSGANSGTFRVYQLSERSRDKIYKDAYTDNDFRAAQFWAGYGDTPPQLFNGNVIHASSYKDSGSVDPVTEIEGLEGVYAMVNGTTSQVWGPNQSFAEMIQKISNDLPYLQNSIVGSVPGKTKRGVSLWGNTWDLIQQYTGGTAFIDNNRVVILQANEALIGGSVLGKNGDGSGYQYDSRHEKVPLTSAQMGVILGQIPIISDKTGLLGSPRRTQAILEFEMVFTPQLQVGQFVVLNSSVNSIYNNVYKVVGFQHSGLISAATAGTARTTVQLWLGPQALYA